MIGNERPFDLLWMPQMMKSHSASPRGGSSIRLDVIREFSKEMIDFVSLTSKEKIKWEDGKEYPLLKVEISSASHPFFTGKQRVMDTEGRIDRFKKKYGKK